MREHICIGDIEQSCWEHPLKIYVVTMTINKMLLIISFIISLNLAARRHTPIGCIPNQPHIILSIQIPKFWLCINCLAQGFSLYK